MYVHFNEFACFQAIAHSLLCIHGICHSEHSETVQIDTHADKFRKNHVNSIMVWCTSFEGWMPYGHKTMPPKYNLFTLHAYSILWCNATNERHTFLKIICGKSLDALSNTIHTWSVVFVCFAHHTKCGFTQVFKFKDALFALSLLIYHFFYGRTLVSFFSLFFLSFIFMNSSFHIFCICSSLPKK